MKRSIALAACLCMFGASRAQDAITAKPNAATTQRNLAAAGRAALTGSFTDERSRPYKGVEVFVYDKDSSISASGYTDDAGHYETNPTTPGVHDVKLVYPGGKRVFIAGVTMKNGLTQLGLKITAPAADTTLEAATVMPAPAKGSKSGKTTTTTVVKTTVTKTTTTKK